MFSYLDHINLWRDELKEWVPSKIFDAHVHLGPPDIMKPISKKRKKEPLTTFTEFTLEEYLEAYKKIFNGKKIIGMFAFGFPLREVDIESANNYISNLMKNNPYIYGFIISDPFNIKKTIDYFNSMLDKGIRFYGVKPYYDLLGKSVLQTNMDEFISFELLEFMNREKLILILHTSGMGMCEKKNQNFVRKISEKFTEIKIILAHMGRFLYPEQFFSFLTSGIAELPSVYMDVSSVTIKEVYIKTLSNEKLWEKILFATDMPYGLITGVEYFSDENGFGFITRENYPFSDNFLQEKFALERKKLTYNTYHVIKSLKDAMEELKIMGKTLTKLKENIFFRNVYKII